MNQTKLESFIESIINIGSGFLISLLMWTFVVVPIWNLPVNMTQNFVITGLFTIVSVIRSYFWRRFFNAGIHKWIHNRTIKRIKYKQDTHPYEF
jgi:membrane protein implicated in regulation of membrane protease activity